MNTSEPTSQDHLDQLLDAIDNLLAARELLCFEELHDETNEAIIKADVVRRGVRDGLAFMADD